MAESDDKNVLVYLLAGFGLGALIGAILIGALHQVTTLTISAEAGILVLGLLLMVFVALAPRGILGLLRGKGER